MRDTTADAEVIQLEAIRRQSPAERLGAALAFSESIRTAALNHLRSLHPDKSNLELVEILTGGSLIPGVSRSGPKRPR